MRRVVVTGLGMVSPVGNSVGESWQRALKAESGVDRITRFPTTDYTVQIAAEVKNFQVGDSMDAKEALRATRFVQYAAKASQEAVKDSGFFGTGNPDRHGCAIGVGLGGLEDIEDSHATLVAKGPRKISPFFIPYTIPNMAAGVVARMYNLRGPNMCTTTACTSGTHGVGEAYMYIQQGLADIMVAGGAESAISPLGIASFAVMRALSTQNADPKIASRPFDKERDGFVMGEGAGVVVLEEYEHAKKRGAKIYAEMVGYGMSCDAYHITSPSPEHEGGQRSMRACLESGKIPLDQVDHINAHGTSTELNDACESIAIGKVFGSHAKNISISSTKGVTGHCLGAAGGLEAVFSVLAIYHKMIPPTANFRTRDEQCPWDYTPQARERAVRYAISNSFGFGGTNGTIAFKGLTN